MYIKSFWPLPFKGTPRQLAHMELHNLHHRSSPSSAAPANQRPSPATSASAGQRPHPATSAPERGTPQEIRAAVTPEQWAKLTRENDTLDKMVHKLAYQVEVLEDEKKSMKSRADKYKNQLKSHVSAQEEFLSKHNTIKAQLKSALSERDRLQARADEHRVAGKKTGDNLAEYKAKLEAATAELKHLKAEIPQVQKLLTQGGEATRRLQAAEAKESKRVHSLQQELEAMRAKARASDERLRAMSSSGHAKPQQLQSEIDSLRERLKAASTQASASISQVQACKEMLTKAEGVLRTCTELHESKGDALASALQQTSANLVTFINTLNKQ